MARPADPAVVLRVFLVDDHPVFRHGLAVVLNADPRFTVVGEASDAPTAVAQLRDLDVQVVVVDLSLRRGSGLVLVRGLKTERPDLGLLVLSMHDEDVYAERALRAGARGYLMKDVGPDRLRDAVWRVAHGDVVVSDRVSASLLRRVVDGPARGATPLATLTDRELEVFRLIGSGQSTREIGQNLHISMKTVETHRANIKQKLALRSTTDLVRAAISATETSGPVSED